MHVRTSRVRRNGKVYEYAQLVETYRRDSDGMPVHRVLATLPDAVAAQNLRDALAAAREGKRVAVTRQSAIGRAKPTANLRYLDLAVLLELWRQLGLDALLEELMPVGDATLPPAKVVAALVLQRCVDPGSKLFAARWLPRTALPELLQLAPESFNNTRLHRVLDELDDVTRQLMAKLPARYLKQEGKFASLFLDVSDAWFVGDGPSLAKFGKTKEGLLRRKVGILLLCNELGYPLRWEVIEGTQHDSVPMTAMLQSLAGVGWASGSPIVCDRAMGKTAQVRTMLATGLRFLTALTSTEFDAYAPTIPHVAFSSLKSSADVQEVAQCALAAGLQRVEDDLFVLDLGVVERGGEPVGDGNVGATSAADAAVEAMRYCREAHDGIATGRFASLAAAGRALGLRKSVTVKYGTLASLAERQQRAVLEGRTRATLTQLLEIATIKDPTARDQAFDALLLTAPSRAPSRRRARSSPPSTARTSVRVRAVAYFNPERWLDERRHAGEQLAAIDGFVDDINAKLRASPRRFTRNALAALVDRRLRQDALLETYRVKIDEHQGGLRLQLELDEDEWARRRRYDGFAVLVAHPELEAKAAELCALYRARDAVEKDFHIIKSVVELRPIRHRNDDKVRAHVTLCMLALLLERMLEHRLKKLGTSAERALELLATCHLNLFKGEQEPAAYATTEPDREQRVLLQVLSMLPLVDDDCLAEKITPR